MDEKIAFKALALSEDERRYIEINRHGVSLRFPMKTSIEFVLGTENLCSADDRRMCPGSDAASRLYEMMTEFWDEEAEKGGFTLKARLDDLSEAEFFKEATTEEEVKSAVLSLVKFKRRFGIA
jgi:hypothetical protein